MGTLQMEHKRRLEESLHSQLGTTNEILQEWENDPYPADGKVVAKFWEYIKNAPAIEIVGDYDCDGICATHILASSIRSVYPDKKLKMRIPRRFSEGYGINETIAKEIEETLPAGSLVITVDNGIAAGAVLDRIKEAGYHVIVTDHHALREDCEPPHSDMVIDPAVESIPNPLTGRYWCGASVAYKMCEPMISEDMAGELSVFAGLATVADCMELKEGNWGMARRAIKAFREKKAPRSLQNLLNAMGQDPDFCNEEHFSFYLGPAFNAPGRLLDKGAVEVLKYLWNPTPERCEVLVKLNNERKEIRDNELAIVQKYIEENGLQNTCPIWVAVPGLCEGIVGILAGKVAEMYGKPAIVLTTVEGNPDMLKGSGRNAGNFDMFKYLQSIPSELFAKMGGHKGAAGLSITTGNFEKARQYQVQMPQEEARKRCVSMPINQWEIPGINATLSKFRPFGEGNETPRFEVEVDTEKDNVRLIGEQKNHLLIQDKNGRYKLTHFNHLPNDLADSVHFGMRGTIAGSAFRGIETPSFNAEEIYDIHDVREKGER